MAETDPLIDKELEDVRERAATLPNTSLVACCHLMVRLRVSKSKMKELDACFQFPPDYPNTLILLELKSKHLPQKFLDSVLMALENDKERFLGKPHIILAFRHVVDFLEANSLCICVQEIANLKKLMQLDSTDSFKIKQKQSLIHFKTGDKGFLLEAKLTVPEGYPASRVEVELVSSNFPELFQTYFLAQAKEIARRCVEPPLLTKKGAKAQPFELKRSLEPAGEFLIRYAKRYPTETCGLCEKKCFPDSPAQIIENMKDRDFVDRVYCTHIFHYGCIDKYMKTPPFSGGKKCPKCESIIYHHKWKESERTREERWAHFQAKQRELEEVADFLA